MPTNTDSIVPPLVVSITTPFLCDVDNLPLDRLAFCAVANQRATVSALIDDGNKIFSFSRLVFDEWSDTYFILLSLIFGRQTGDILDTTKGAVSVLFSKAKNLLEEADPLSESALPLLLNLSVGLEAAKPLFDRKTIPQMECERFSAEDLEAIAKSYPDALYKDLQTTSLRLTRQWALDQHSWIPRFATATEITFSLIDDHPSCGSGMSVSMKLPLEMSGGVAVDLANSLNVASVTDAPTMMFVGAWSTDATSVKFGFFLPDFLKKHDEILLLLCRLEEQQSFAHEFISDFAMRLGREALALRESHEYEPALEKISHALQLDPYSGDLNNYMGIVQRSLGDYERAITSFTRATNFDPSLGKAHHNRAMLYEQLGRISEAREAYQEAISSYQDAIETGVADEQTYVRLGLAFLSIGDLEGAVRCDDEGIERFPFSAAIYSSRAHVFWVKKDMPRAINDYETAVKLGDRTFVTMNNLGTCCLRNEQFEKAIDWFTEALQIDGTRAGAYEARAEAYRRMGNEHLAQLDEDRASEIEKELLIRNGQ
jgi:tetratricopeptide (TPR) repeat protein